MDDIVPVLQTGSHVVESRQRRFLYMPEQAENKLLCHNNMRRHMS